MYLIFFNYKNAFLNYNCPLERFFARVLKPGTNQSCLTLSSKLIVFAFITHLTLINYSSPDENGKFKTSLEHPNYFLLVAPLELRNIEKLFKL